MEERKKIAVLTASEAELNDLFKETLDSVRDDIVEAQENADMYLDAINEIKTGGKELYGTLYNEALKIKGLAQERRLKFLNMFKDRVTKKEQIDLASSGIKQEVEINHQELNKLLQEIKVSSKINLVKNELEIVDEDNEEDEIESYE